ncbi:hypothetical protein Tco_1112842 [Tanacetum coccineum]|uniref:Reverse transcriptase Ty1/copia-type domain-containing protein n=1 Tax=Tanacetum coccineum TaxID=301880 RepID=A0ABQ5IU59_9ASTR
MLKLMKITLVQDGDVADVDEHLYRSMIGSLMYLTASRPDIMFADYACARFQVSPKTSHLLAVKRIFRHLKGKPSLGLWYSKDSPLELVAYTNSDYAGATQDRKSTTEGYQFLGNRLISWQCKKQTVVATSTTEVEYVAAANCCRQEVMDFIKLLTPNQSHISYALTKKPEIYISFIKQFWRTAEASTDTDGEVTITAIIDGQSKTITEASLRRHLKLEDHDDMQKKQLKTHSSTYPVPSLNNKVFSNIRRLTKGYTGVEIGLFPTMLTSPTPESSPTPSSSPSRITSSPSISSEPSTTPTFEPQPSHDVEYHVPTPNESPLYVVHSHGSDEGSLKLNELTNLVTKLSERIGVLEDNLKKTKQTTRSEHSLSLFHRIKKYKKDLKSRLGKAMKRARLCFQSMKKKRVLPNKRRIMKTLTPTLAQDEEVGSLIKRIFAAERQPEDSTAGITVSTAPINISTARETRSTAGRVVYGRRSKEARKDKGKAIMTEPEPEKKSKKLLENRY